MKYLNFALLLVIALLTACNDTRAPKLVQALEKTPPDILITDRDTTVIPADDFFDYANGGWVKNNAIPDDQTQWGIGQLVNEEIYKRKLAINQEAADLIEPVGVNQQISDFWKAAMDTLKINESGIKGLKTELDMIAAIAKKEHVQEVTAKLHQVGVGAFFSEYVTQDAKASDKNAYYISQGGLGLPNRDYYFNTDEKTVAIRAAYPGYIAHLFKLMGISADSAQQKATQILALETTLAKASKKLEDLRDPYANYNKIAINKLDQWAPNTNWNMILHTIGVQAVDSVIVGQPEFLKVLNKLWSSTDIEILKDYLRFHLVNNFSAYLGDSLSNAKFNFYGKTIRGALQQKPYWKRVLDAEEGAIGEALGQLFAKEYFNETAKKRYSDMVEGVRAAYKQRILQLDWMSDSTKQKALVKLAAMKKKVGYPDKWKDFSAMIITKESFVGNMLSANRWWNSYGLNKLGKPVDRDEWEMTPQTYNAYYNPSNNEIVLPAGIFTVPGFRDNELDDALVWGYAGASTIGHEITHGFDDEGRQYDAEGNLKNWWSKQDEKEFNRRAQVLVAQFNKMVVVDGKTINGKATLGENLADLGGLLIAADAFMQTETYKKGELINGLTPMQRYFMGYALGWLYMTRPDELASRLMTDVHAPAKQRVNGPMPNIPSFYKAFNVQPNNKLYLPDSLQVHLW